MRYWRTITKYLFGGFLVAVLALGIAAQADLNVQQGSQDEQALLQQQLQDIENQITQYQQQLKGVQGQKNTLQNKIKLLQNQQKSLLLQIKATTLQLADLAMQQAATEASIGENLAKQQQLRQQMAQAVRLIDENDRYPLVYTVAAQGNLSDALDRVQNYADVSASLGGLLDQAKQVSDQLSQQDQALISQQDQAKNLLSVQSLQQQQLSDSVGQQSTLLRQTRGQEAAYQATLSNTQQQANEIRGRLYQMLGVTTQVTFGEAAKIAQWASAQTGVRPAFLLAVLTQESNLGKNVGTCNRPGDPAAKSYKAVMNPTRDIPPFLQITAALGMNPDIAPVSCPMRDSKGNQVGWGGAMGPAQFIPSTWTGYQGKIASLTGKAANPWDIRDAFLAAALKLAADGGTAQSGEWAAAMKYFSGSTNSKYTFYGDSVTATAAQYQNDLNQLSN